MHYIKQKQQYLAKDITTQARAAFYGNALYQAKARISSERHHDEMDEKDQ